MAAVLPFDPEFRRRTPATAARRTRETPLSTRAVRAIAAPELVDRRGALRVPTSIAAPAPVARAGADVGIRAAVAAPAAAVDERALAREFFPLVLIVALLDLATKALAVAGWAPTRWGWADRSRCTWSTTRGPRAACRWVTRRARSTSWPRESWSGCS
jgi:hypothetical protein